MAGTMRNLTCLLRFGIENLKPSRKICANVSFPAFFHFSFPLLAEPMKKKKKIDPQIIKAREERRKKRIEKSIRKLERNAKQLKPLEEIDLPINLQKEKWLRNRSKSVIESDYGDPQVLRAWCNYKYQQHLLETKMVDRIATSQSRALEQLGAISEDLYISAIQIDNSLVPFTAVGPKTTPSHTNYDAPDGEYIDETPKWN